MIKIKIIIFLFLELFEFELFKLLEFLNKNISLVLSFLNRLRDL